MALLLEGKAPAQAIRDSVASEVQALYETYGVRPKLAVVRVGNDPASESYVRSKERACKKAGIDSLMVLLDESIDEATLLEAIDRLNEDETVHGILLQLPIPNHLDSDKAIARIRPDKDVDGFTPKNIASLVAGKPDLVPCTPLGVMRMLEYYDIPIEGKECVIVGRSQIVGKPMAFLLLKANGTVTICHSRTKDLPSVCQRADILVVAIGRARMIDETYVKAGAVVIDVGISKTGDEWAGDVDFDKVEPLAGAITPVPGGVGLMTVACLLENTLTCYRKQVR